jgi:hypothetical protein
MTNQPTTIEKLRGLPWSIAANVANTIFSQFTFFGSVFPLFLGELRFSKSQMGFLTGVRLELALCLARLVGDEHHFIYLVRRLRDDLGTASAQAVLAFKRKADKNATNASQLDPLLTQCAEAFARDDFVPALEWLSAATHLIVPQHYQATEAKILNECAIHLSAAGIEQKEYLLLALHTLDVGWQG